MSLTCVPVCMSDIVGVCLGVNLSASWLQLVFGDCSGLLGGVSLSKWRVFVWYCVESA